MSERFTFDVALQPERGNEGQRVPHIGVDLDELFCLLDKGLVKVTPTTMAISQNGGPKHAILSALIDMMASDATPTDEVETVEEADTLEMKTDVEKEVIHDPDPTRVMPAVGTSSEKDKNDLTDQGTRRQQLIDLVNDRPGITLADIASGWHISVPGVRHHVRKAVEQRDIRQVGSQLYPQREEGS